MPFNLGPTEMIFVLVVLLLVFGAKRLPELGSGLGKGIREFRRSMKDITSEIERGDEPERIHQPAPRASVPPTVERKPDETQQPTS
jgi:sec-independent protein translocase protein TatA